MPTIVVNKWDLLSMLRVSERELEDLLFNLKSESKEVDPDHLEIEINNDRPDLLHPFGIKRAIDGLLERAFGEPKYETVKTDYKLVVRDVPTRPYALAAVVYGVKLSGERLKELIQFQEKLHVTVGRKRAKVAIGLHDLKKVTSKAIEYKEIPFSTRFVPLGQSEEMTVKEVLERTEQGLAYGRLSVRGDKTPAIVEDNGSVLSIPPVINAEKTRLEESTTDLFIDVTGTSLEAVGFTLDLIVTALAEGGAKIGLVDVVMNGETTTSPRLRRYKLSATKDYINSRLGTSLSEEEMVRLLRMARMDASSSKGIIEVTVPPYRADLLAESDIAEEVAQVYGYRRLEPSKQKFHRPGRLLPMTHLARSLRDLAVGAGFLEIYTFAFIRKEYLSGEFVRVTNPVTEEFTAIRNSLIPSTLLFLSRNQNSRMPVKVFEINEVVVRNQSTETGYKNAMRMALALMDYQVSYEMLQAPLHAVLEALGLKPAYVKATSEGLIEGRTAEIVANGRKIGVIGEVSPEELEKFDLRFPVVIAELYLDEIQKAIRGDSSS
jgi:phenylalanyl-tRNA synthetase beta chain